LLVFFVLFVRCKKDNIDDSNYLDTVKKYAPFQVGSQLFYQVDSTIYDDFKDTTLKRTTYRRFLIDSLDNSIQGRVLFRVVVSETEDTSKNWSHVRVDQWAITQQYFETQTENIRFTHLIFPVNYESQWNANQYSTLREQQRYYTEIESTFQMGNIDFPKTLQVENEPKKNSVVDIQYQEVFAENIGCVYKKITNIEIQFGKPRGYSVINTLYAYKL